MKGELINILTRSTKEKTSSADFIVICNVMVQKCPITAQEVCARHMYLFVVDKLFADLA